MWTDYSYLGRLSDAHDYKWFGLKGLNAKDSLAQYGIAARYLGGEYECYAPDPEEDDCSIYFKTTGVYIDYFLQNSPQLAKFMYEKRITLNDFKLLGIPEKIHLLCDFFNIIDLLELNIDECYERDTIELDDTDDVKSLEEEANDALTKKKIRIKNPLLVEDFADKSFVPLLKAIQTVVEEFGIEIVSKSKFVNILDDYHGFKGIPGIKRIFHIFADNGYLLDWTDDNINITDAFIAKTSKTISLKYGFNEDWVKNSMAAILVALGYAYTESNTKQGPKGTANYPSKYLDSYDLYINKCGSYIYNKIKKDSYLPDKKGVLYSSDKMALVSIGEFSRSSYFIRKGTMYIAPNAWRIPYESQATELELYIPDSVVAIGYCAFLNTCIHNLEIPSSVKLIGWMAFQDSKLSNITLHDGLEYIGNAAFKYTNLVSIRLPKTLKYVGGDAFPNGIEIINQSDFLSVRDGMIYNREETFLMCCTSKEAVIHLPDTVEEINPYAFSYNSNIINIELGKSLRKIGRRAFSNCEKLKSIILPESLEEIGDGAFEECEELYSLEIPPKVIKIGSNIIESCSSLSEVRCLSPYFEVVDDALYDVKEKKLIAYFGIDREFEVKKGTKIIGQDAFQNITSLKKVTLPKSVTLVEIWAFDDCTELEELRVLNPACEFEFDDCGVDDGKIVKG